MKMPYNNNSSYIMRNNAHFASAFLHNDNARIPNHDFSMKSERDIFLELVSHQKAYIDSVIQKKSLPNTTTLANKSKVAASTINRFYNAVVPENALTARTIAKIETYSGIPYSPPGESQSIKGVMRALEVLLSSLVRKGAFEKEELEIVFNSQLRESRQKGQQDEAEVMDQLLGFLHAEFSSSEHRDQKQSQRQHQDQLKKEKS